MPRKKPRFQTRLARSARMQSATVKRAIAAQPDDGRRRKKPRSGGEYVGPSPATDAVLAGQAAGHRRRAAVELGGLLGIMALVALAVVFFTGTGDQPPDLTPATVNILLILAAVTGLLGLLIVFRRWQQGRKLVAGLTPAQRRFELVAGPLRVQDRLDRDNAHEYWLRAPGSDWMPIDRSTFDRLEPILVASQRDDLSLGRQTENDVAHDWSIPDATVLFHRRTRTVVEVHDAEGELVYRHPRYRPRD